jgi:hypothetical protein
LQIIRRTDCSTQLLSGQKMPQMTNDALPTYLQDHLAGALHAIEILKAMRSHFSGEPLGQFADQMLAEVQADREVLARLTERAGGTAGGVKEWAAWLSEKVSRLKLKHGSADGLGTFEALEFLVIGIHGKWALWRALAEVAALDERLQGVDFGELTARAQNQHQKVEERRLACAQSVFRTGGGNGEHAPFTQSGSRDD